MGALAINTVAGVGLSLGLAGLGIFAVAYSLYGGLRAVALTDIIQVILLVMGGLMISWILLDQIGAGAGPIAGFTALTQQAPDKFHMILKEGHPHYMSLPGLSVLPWWDVVMNLSYWGFNQYIIQRALAAKMSMKLRRASLLPLKLLMPVIVVLPGIGFRPESEPSAPDKAIHQ